MMAGTYENFMIFGLESTGEKVKLDVSEDEFCANNGQNVLDPHQVLVIVKEDLRRIYIWKGVNSHVRKKFIASHIAAELQSDLVVNGHFHRCKIISVDQGDEPLEFMRAFSLKATIVPEVLERDSVEFKQLHTSSLKGSAETNDKKVYGWKGPPPKRTGKGKSHVIARKVDRDIELKPKQSTKPPKLDNKNVIKKIVTNKVPANFKRQNLILGNFQIFGNAIKKAKIFGEEVEEVEWEPVNSLPVGIIELTDRTLRIYVNETSKTIEGIEILQKLEAPKVAEQMVEKGEEVDYKTWTVKQLRIYCQENNIKVPVPFRKAQIISLIKKGPSQESIKPDSNYKTWTVKQLKEYCKKNDIKVLSTYRKADLLKFVEEHQK